jgi:hypothetical protein
MGKAGFLATTAQEALLHATQQTRTFEESALNVASGTLLTAMLGGGAVSLLTPAERAGLAEKVRADRGALNEHAGNPSYRRGAANGHRGSRERPSGLRLPMPTICPAARQAAAAGAAASRYARTQASLGFRAGKAAVRSALPHLQIDGDSR